ncbi:thioesterase family protein [Xylophilus sp. GW821-FHT01B05]
MSTHPLDEALQLQAVGEHRWRGTPSAAYWNMVGPFGGSTAATLLQAVLRHPDLLGTPLSLTVNYAGALTAAPFEIEARPVRTNRSTQHWTITQTQPGDDGQPVVATTATVVTAARRDTWSLSDMPMPAVPAPAAVEPITLGSVVEWVRRYEMRPVRGPVPQRWDGQGEDSVSQLWMRDAEPRALDFCSLAAISDVFFPRVWLRRATQVPAGTVSITTYFHAGAAELAQTGSGYLLGQARAQEFRNGFFDQNAQLWNEAGTMLATSHQVVYFKQ